MSVRDDPNFQELKQLIERSKVLSDVFYTDEALTYEPEAGLAEGWLRRMSPGALQKMYESAEREWLRAGEWFYQLKDEIDRRGNQ